MRLLKRWSVSETIVKDGTLSAFVCRRCIHGKDIVNRGLSSKTLIPHYQKALSSNALPRPTRKEI